MVEQELMTCSSCGATVYPEHVQSGRARRMAGKLLCPHCVHEAQTPAARPAGTAVGDEEQLEPVPLVDGPPPGPTGSTPAGSAHSSAPRSGGGAVGTMAAWNDARYTRPLSPEGGMATRCRIFHAKLNDGALAFMNDQINAWTDAHPDIHIKFATSTIGVFEGKHSDPNLIVTLFY